MLGAALVGIIGVFPHLAANGVALNKLGPLLNGSVLHGEPGPQWPLAITIGSVLGLIAAYGLADDQEYTRGSLGWFTAMVFALLIVGIALCDNLTTLGWGAAAIVIAAILLLAVTLANIASSSSESMGA